MSKPDYALPAGKPEIWWTIRAYAPGDLSVTWICTVAQSWSKAREALGDYEGPVCRASKWREVFEKRPR